MPISLTDVTSAVTLTEAPDFSGTIEWNLAASGITDTLTTDDVLLMVFLGETTAGAWDFSTAPSDWDELYTELWTEPTGGTPDTSYWRFNVFTKVWEGEDQSTYTADWESSFGVNGVVLAALTSGGTTITPGTSSHEVGAPVPGSYPYSGSDVEFDFTSTDVLSANLAQADLGIADSGIFIAGFTFVSGWSFTPGGGSQITDEANSKQIALIAYGAGHGVAPSTLTVHIAAHF